MPRRCPAYGKRFSGCDKANHSEKDAEARADRSPDMMIDKEVFTKQVKTLKKKKWQYMWLKWYDKDFSIYIALNKS